MLSLLLALDKPKVNYFSLDIEGAELQVLRSVPWHLVDIEVLPLYQFHSFLRVCGEILLERLLPSRFPSLGSCFQAQGRRFVNVTELTAFHCNECFAHFHCVTFFSQKKLPQGFLFNNIFAQLHSLLTENGFQYVGTLGGKVFSDNCKNILFGLITVNL